MAMPTEANWCRRTFVLTSDWVASILLTVLTTCPILTTRCLEEHRVIRVCFDVFLEILWTLEGFAAELAAMRFQGDMDADMGCDVVAFDDLNAASSPRTLQIEIVGALATDMAFTNVILHVVSVDDFAMLK